MFWNWIYIQMKHFITQLTLLWKDKVNKVIKPIEIQFTIEYLVNLDVFEYLISNLDLSISPYNLMDNR